LYQTGALPIFSNCVVLFLRSGDEPDRAIFHFGAPRPAMTHDVHYDEIRASVCYVFGTATTITTASHARVFSHCDIERYSVSLVGFPTLHR
jgi:hypothetical protein